MEKQINIPALRFSEFKSESKKKKLADIAEFCKELNINTPF